MNNDEWEPADLLDWIDIVIAALAWAALLAAVLWPFWS